MSLHQHITQMLAPRYGEREAQALSRALLEDEAGLALSDILLGKDELLSEEEQQRLLTLAQRIAQGEPYQYVVGYQQFCRLRIGVAPGVLIPRPETEEWVEAVVKEISHPTRLLDLCTGSGCIALALKHAFPEAYVEGRDLSAEALAIARKNAASLGLDVCFRQEDILHATSPLVGAGPRPRPEWSAIVANPPYVLRSERPTLSEHVAAHEPEMALFVPDEDPMLFHQAIARYARHTLIPGGLLAMEINERLPEDTATMLAHEDFVNIHIRPDLYGKPRLALAQQPCRAIASAGLPEGLSDVSTG